MSDALLALLFAADLDTVLATACLALQIFFIFTIRFGGLKISKSKLEGPVSVEIDNSTDNSITVNPPAPQSPPPKPAPTYTGREMPSYALFIEEQCWSPPCPPEGAER